ncbi:MAG TPA: lipase maturation factor family protein, partial [Candidatus Xenobia bacterium]
MLTHFWWVRFAILRLLGLVYLVAFAVAIRQNRALIGSNGLTPMRLFLRQVRDEPHPFWNTPTLFWLDDSDRALAVVAWSGAAVSLAVLLGAANALMMALLWVLYQSLVQVGQVWYRFGWESLLLETGFLAIFLCPLLAVRPFPATAPPVEIIWLFRWLGFRVMLGAGLIKLRGDECWKKL